MPQPREQEATGSHEPEHQESEYKETERRLRELTDSPRISPNSSNYGQKMKDKLAIRQMQRNTKK